MLIVCAVLAALAGMSWPAMRGMLAKARLQEAADAVQTALRKARVQAVRDGRITLLMCEPGGRRYRVGDWDSVLLTTKGAGTPTDLEPGEGSTPADTARSGRPAGRIVDLMLPEGVRFAPESEQLREVSLAAQATGADAPTPADSRAEPQWGDPVVFRTNGRSDDAEIRLIDERQFVVVVRMRGLTGTVSATAPRRLEPVLNEPAVPSPAEPEGTP